ncbi:MAG: AMP-binding protein, partial [Planctomycetes bacterium]|nr:AMP-binding protein [Planctomycetota bacterium]
LLLTQAGLKSQLPDLPDLPGGAAAHGREIIRMDETDFQSQPGENPAINRCMTDLAYVIYTSGSTGKPKGVMIEHKGLVNLAFSQIDTFQLLPDSRVLQFASFSFDASVSEITTTLLCGATLYIPNKSILLDPTDFTAMMTDQKISHVTFPPSFLSNLSKKVFPDLKTIVVAGEACPAELMGQWAGQVRFINAYGPTENTVCASMAVCFPKPEALVHIGRPIPNIRIYILDRRHQPVPPGIPGELCI